MKFGEVTLATECPKCKGSMRVQADSRDSRVGFYVNCYECDGKGKILTSDGEALKEFFEGFVKLNVTVNLRSEVKAD